MGESGEIRRGVESLRTKQPSRKYAPALRVQRARVATCRVLYVRYCYINSIVV